MLDVERLEREIFREIARERRANVFRSLISFSYASLSLFVGEISREKNRARKEGVRIYSIG